MYLAPGIFSKIIANYANSRHLPYNLRYSQNISSKNITKDPENPQGDYQKWVSEHGVTYDRDTIIAKHNNGIRVFRLDSPNTEGKSTINSDSDADSILGSDTDSILDSDADSILGSDSDTDSEYLQPRTRVSHTNSTTNSTIQRVTPQAISAMTHPEQVTKLFQVIPGIRWCDKDTGVCTVANLKRINYRELKLLMPTMIRLADELKPVMSDATTAFDNMSDEDQYNFLFHIIAKGQQFYFSCIIEPGFCTYMLPDQYQPLYTIMKKLFSI